jgi:hypothetical protein
LVWRRKPAGRSTFSPGSGGFSYFLARSSLGGARTTQRNRCLEPGGHRPGLLGGEPAEAAKAEEHHADIGDGDLTADMEGRQRCRDAMGKRAQGMTNLPIARGIDPMASREHSSSMASEKSGIPKELFWLAAYRVCWRLNPEKIAKFRENTVVRTSKATLLASGLLLRHHHLQESHFCAAHAITHRVQNAIRNSLTTEVQIHLINKNFKAELYSVIQGQMLGRPTLTQHLCVSGPER